MSTILKTAKLETIPSRRGVRLRVEEPPGIRLEVVLTDDGSLHIEAYDWHGRPVEFQSARTGEHIDDKRGDWPHPALIVTLGEDE